LGAALGHGAVFGSATNTLLAPIAITGAVFGFQYTPLFAFVCAVAFYCNGNHSIYRLQRAATRWELFRRFPRAVCSRFDLPRVCPS